MSGALRLVGVKPGLYSLVISQPGYHEDRRTINLAPGHDETLSVILSPIPGKLNVSPSIDGTEITIRKVRGGPALGTYREQISDLEVEPGDYQITVSKSGYKTTTRNVSVKPAQSAYLEPLLETAPVERQSVRHDAAMSVQTVSDGRDLTVVLSGKSGELSSLVGALDVTVSVNDRAPSVSNVTGMLTGFPCQVDFVRIENIAEYSFIEPPGVGNQWGRVVVRVRPKDSKRPLHFSINWKSLRFQAEEPRVIPSNSAIIPSDFQPAAVIKKVTPIYPSTARDARTFGTVSVAVDIDERGDVKSARAVDGPGLLRQAAETAARQWKFRPAMSQGRPVRSTQTIQFNFKPE
jgi:TonB family protein